MDGLTSLPVGLLTVGWLAAMLVVLALGRRAARALVAEDDRERIANVTAPLMPALGATFGVLIAITLSSEAGYLKTAQDTVSTEAAAASRLAWAATSAGVETRPIHEALRTYLRATRSHEWGGDTAGEGDDEATLRAIAELERTVRREATRADLGTPISTELLAALDGVTTTRRARVAEASRDLPALYALTLAASGIALVANAGAASVGVRRRTAVLAVGLAVVVGLSLALLFSLSAPWRGGLVVSGDPIDDVVAGLDSGFFSR